MKICVIPDNPNAPGSAHPRFGVQCPCRGEDVPPLLLQRYTGRGQRGPVARLQRDPLLWQERRREIALLGRSRRPDYRTLRWMASHGQTLVALQSIATGDGQIDPRLAVDQPVTLTTLDHPATRYVAFLLVRLSLSLEATARAFGKVAGAAGEGRSIEPEMQKRAARLGRLLQAAVSEIRTTMRTGIFRSVAPAPMSESALQAIGGHPLYARVHRLARQLLDPGLRLAKPMTPAELTGSLRTSFDLYELFVLHRLRHAVRDLAGEDWEFHDGELASGMISATSVSVSTRWSATSPDGRTRLALDYQPTFRAHNGRIELIARAFPANAVPITRSRSGARASFCAGGSWTQSFGRAAPQSTMRSPTSMSIGTACAGTACAGTACAGTACAGTACAGTAWRRRPRSSSCLHSTTMRGDTTFSNTSSGTPSAPLSSTARLRPSGALM